MFYVVGTAGALAAISYKAVVAVVVDLLYIVPPIGVGMVGACVLSLVFCVVT